MSKEEMTLDQFPVISVLCRGVHEIAVLVRCLPLRAWAARELHEQLYCARGEMENRIKEAQLDLFVDRLSTAATCSCTRCGLGLVGTALARACANTIGLKLLKIGAVVTVSVRRVRVAMSQVCLERRDGLSRQHDPDNFTPQTP